MIYDGTGTVEGGNGWYLVVLGQQQAVLGQYKAERAESIVNSLSSRSSQSEVMPIFSPRKGCFYVFSFVA